MAVFKKLFARKELINLPSEHQEDKTKLQSQMEQQVEKVRTSLLAKMKKKRQRHVGAIRAETFTYKELTSLVEGLIGGIEQGVKFELEQVFRLVVENQCIECCNRSTQNYIADMQHFLQEDKPQSPNNLLVVFSELRETALEHYNSANAACMNSPTYFQLYLQYKQQLEILIEEKERQASEVNLHLMQKHDL